jgi:tetratricopeptide (TPR) repeat protein
MNNDYSNAMIGLAQQSVDLPLEKRKELAKKGIYFSANAVNIYPLFSNAWVHHGNAYVTMGNFIQLEADSLRKISSPNAIKYYNEVLKLYNHSLTIYQKAQKYSPDSTTIYGNLAIIYRTRGNLFASLEKNKEAIADFEQANKFTYGKDVEINRLLAASYGVTSLNSLKSKDTLSSQDSYQKCLNSIDRGIKIMPIHMLATIANLENAYKALAKENKEFEAISIQRAEELNKIIKPVDPNYKGK